MQLKHQWEGRRVRFACFEARIKRGVCAVQSTLATPNEAGAAFRADTNTAHQANATSQSGAAAPGTTYVYQMWADTTNNVMKRRNASNSAWIVVGTLDETFFLSRAANTVLGISDRFPKGIRATAGYTQTFAAAATLGDGWVLPYRVESGVTVVFDPNGAETIDGGATKSVVGPSSGFIHCDGTAFYTNGFTAGGSGSITASGYTQNTARLLGRTTAAAGAIEEISVSGGTFAAGVLTVGGGITLGTPTASTSGTSIDYTSIPAGVKRITAHFNGVSSNGTSNFLIQLGDSGGIETSGYTGAGWSVAIGSATSTAGFLIRNNSGSSVVQGALTMAMNNSTTHNWTAWGVFSRSDSAENWVAAGCKAVSAGPVDRVRFTTVSGTDTWDLGEVNITTES